MQVQGAEKFAALGRAYKAAGKRLPRELHKAAGAATKPLKAAIRANALADLPARGGLNVWAAKATIRTTVRATGPSVGVRVVGSRKGGDLASLNEGRVFHPTFGHGPVVSQSVRGGFWDRAAEQVAPHARAEFLHAVDRVAADIHL